MGRIQLGSPLIGHVNVLNILAATAAAYARGCSLQQIREGVLRLDRVPGRFERVDCGQPFTVVVDYAHTDDALKNVTRVAREFVNRGGAGRRVITLFGCGGDRDQKLRRRRRHADRRRLRRVGNIRTEHSAHFRPRHAAKCF